MQSRLCPGAAGSIVSGLKQQRQVLGAAGPGPQRHRVVAHLLHSCLLCYVLKIDCGCVALGFCAPITWTVCCPRSSAMLLILNTVC